MRRAGTAGRRLGEGAAAGVKDRALERWLCLAVLAALSAALCLLVAWMVWHRFFFPYELSKMEGGLVDHARWLARGRPLYAEPTAEFVPFLYMPLSHLAGSVLVRLGVDGYIAARAVALLGVAVATAVGMAVAARGTRTRGLWILVPVLVAAGYFDVHCFYDQARPDNLMAAFGLLAVGALTLARPGSVVVGFVCAGLLAFWTKQSITVFLFALLAGYAFVSWRTALACAVVLALAITGSFAVVNAGTDGWLHAYTVEAPAYHTLDTPHLIEGLRNDLLGSFAVPSLAIGLAAAALLLTGSAPPRDADALARTRFLVVVAGVAAGGFAAASIWQPISIKNVYVMYVVVAAVALPVILDWAVERIGDERQRALAFNLALLLLCAVVARGLRHPAPFLPTDAHAARWAEFRERLAGYGPPERAWVTLHGAALGGDRDAPMQLHLGALLDLVGGHFGGKTPYEIPPDLLRRIDEQHWDVVVVADWDRRARELLAGRYVPDPAAEPFRLPAFAGYGEALERFWVRAPGPLPPYQPPTLHD